MREALKRDGKLGSQRSTGNAVMAQNGQSVGQQTVNGKWEKSGNRTESWAAYGKQEIR